MATLENIEELRAQIEHDL